MKKAAYFGCVDPRPFPYAEEYATMNQATNAPFVFPSPAAANATDAPVSDPLTDVLRQGARAMLAQAVEAEAQQWIVDHAHLIDHRGRRQVVRNGHADERTIVTGVGPLSVRMPRLHDRRPAEEREPFTSKILPPYLRKTRSIEELIPWLYLKGISTGDYNEALHALVGHDCPGLSASTVVRLKQVWEQDYRQWTERDLLDKRYVYIWADGIHFNVRLEEDRTCILVLMGATAEGKKELIAAADGYRESEQSWKNLLLDVKQRGLTIDPELATGDGALGFWKALPQVFPKTRTQRCWVHKTANVLNELPKRLHGEAKDSLHQIWMAPTKKGAQAAFDHFVNVYEAKYPRATNCLTKDRDELLTFYDFPAQHWMHIRTTNPIESTFATVRLRTRRTKGCGSRLATLTMVFKLAESAQKKWRRLNGHDLIGDVIAGITFHDGARSHAA